MHYRIVLSRCWCAKTIPVLARGSSVSQRSVSKVGLTVTPWERFGAREKLAETSDVSVRLYFEGTNGLRKPMKSFLLRGLGSINGRLDAIAGGGREQTTSVFRAALSQHRKSFLVLLLDSEVEYHDGLRAEATRKVGAKVRRDQIFWMVQSMEAWFLADPQALHDYYRRGLREKALPTNRNVEEIGKRDLLRSLNDATRTTGPGPYLDNKAAHAIELLKILNPGRVRAAAPKCEELFRVLQQKLVR